MNALPDNVAPRSWHQYLEWFHGRRPGITEEILARAVGDVGGMNPYKWALQAISSESRVLDLACGSAPLASAGTIHHWVGIDRSTAELSMAREHTAAPLVRGDASALPFASGSFDVVACVMGLMVFEDVDVALAEIHRVLRSTGTAVFLLPGSYPLRMHDRLRYLRVLIALRSFGPKYPNRVHLGRLGARLGQVGLHAAEDDRERFSFPIPDEASGRRFIESLYAPGRSERRVERAVAIARRWIGSEIGVPLRRVVCVREH